MRALVAERRRGQIGDTLILVEHPPVVTVGVQGDDGSAARSGFPVVEVERGGHATYHGPGQLVGYPIVDLAARGQDVRRFVHELQALLSDSLVPLGLAAGPVAGQPGLWIDGRRKVASIGIAVDHWVSFHGFALNVDPDLGAFARFRPCAMDGEVMTSVSRELGRPVALQEVRAPLVGAWEARFGPVRAGAGASSPLGPAPTAPA